MKIPAGTRFGGWLYSVNDRISGVGDFDGDGKVEILITSDWGIGILKQQGDTFDSPVIHPAGTRFGGWLYSVNDRISAVGDFDGDGRVDILITSDWGIGSSNSRVTLSMRQLSILPVPDSVVRYYPPARTARL